MTSPFKGRAAIVTGASSGIGRSIAERLGAAGMDLWLIGRSATALAETAETASTGGGRIETFARDIGEAGVLGALIDGIDHDHLFAVVNAAGVMYPEPILSSDLARWRELLDINVMAPIEACQAGVRKMRAQGKPGHLINFSSLTARWDAGGVYGASKIAIEMIGRTIRKELERDDIRITTIVPGGFVSQLSRGFPPEMLEALSGQMGQLDASPEQLLGDPALIAQLVQYILEQPIMINLSEVVIRPPIDLSL